MTVAYFTPRAWVKRVCCVSKISSNCGCQSKEIGVGMEVRLLSVGTRGFFLAASRLAIAAQFCRPQREKNLWHQGIAKYSYNQMFMAISLKLSFTFINWDLRFRWTRFAFDMRQSYFKPNQRVKRNLTQTVQIL